MLRRCLLAVLLAAFALPLLAQNSATPDLSGTWKLNRVASKIPSSTTGLSETIYIDCTGSTFRWNVTADTTDQSHTWVADGLEHSVAHVESGASQRGYDLIHVAYWKKASLITETTIRVSPHAGAEMPTPRLAVRWTLAKDGRQLSSESENPRQTLVYDKQ